MKLYQTYLLMSKNNLSHPNSTCKRNYFFVDESGDSTFFNKKKRCIVGEEGCSSILLLGFIKTQNPKKLRKEIEKLHEEIRNDEYLKDIPSIKKTNIHFHAKDDCPEVREKVFKLLKTLDFKAEFVVARKKSEIFEKRHKKNENIFYNELVSSLFEENLHHFNNTIYFSKRGSQTKQHHFQSAIQTEMLTFEGKKKRSIETQTKIYIQVPSDEPCLQIVDYMNWVVYRAFTKGEMRYFSFLQEKISILSDIYDFEKIPQNIYDTKNTFNIQKISPLELVPQRGVARHEADFYSNRT